MAKLNVYNRLLGMLNRGQDIENIDIIYMATINLTNINEIIDFVKEYSKMYKTYENDISYVLSFTDQDVRDLWKKALGETINFDLLYNASEAELYANYQIIDEKGNIIPYKINEEYGKHQSH